MTGIEVGMAAIVLMLLAVYFGMHIGIALMAVSFVGIWVLKSPVLAARMVAEAQAREEAQRALAAHGTRAH